MSRTALTLLLALSLALAGCLGGGGGADVESQGADTMDDGTGDAGEDVATANNTTGPSWVAEYRNGTVEGTNLVVITNGANDETFTVPDGAEELIFNFTAHEGELWISISPPGCEGGFMSSCTERADTSDGSSTWSTSNPDTGTWTVTLYKGDPGTMPVEYTVERAVLSPATS